MWAQPSFRSARFDWAECSLPALRGFEYCPGKTQIMPCRWACNFVGNAAPRSYTKSYVPLAAYSSCLDVNKQYQSKRYRPRHAKTCLREYADREGPDQPAHPCSLIRVFAFRLHKLWTLQYVQMHSNCPNETFRIRWMNMNMCISKTTFCLARSSVSVLRNPTIGKTFGWVFSFSFVYIKLGY